MLEELNWHVPEIVHFSGHGEGEEGLVLKDENGQSRLVSTDDLKTIFSSMRKKPRLVVLNACLTTAQGHAINQVIDCVVGMNKSIGDEAAISFAEYFYSAITNGCSLKDAFEQGTLSLKLKDIPEENTPELLHRSDIDPDEIYFVNNEKNKKVIASHTKRKAGVVGINQRTKNNKCEHKSPQQEISDEKSIHNRISIKWKGLKKLLFNNKKLLVLIATSLAGIVLFFQNIDYLLARVSSIFGNRGDLIIVDQFMAGDTVDIRIQNRGEKIVSLREAIINVENTWQIPSEAAFFDYVEGKYDIYLRDSLKPYSARIKIFESIKPNDVNRFQIIIQGGDGKEQNPELSEALKQVVGSDFKKVAYFIKFKLNFYLNNTNRAIVSKSMIHVLGSLSASNFAYIPENSAIDYKKKYRDQLEQIEKFKDYKSDKANLVLNSVLYDKKLNVNGK